MTKEKTDNSKLMLPPTNTTVSSREISLTQAVSYPFFKENWLNMLLLPIFFGTGAISICMFMKNQTELQILVFSFFVLSLLGYAWRLIFVLQADGYAARAPDWSLEKMVWCCWDGFKLSLVLGTFAFILFLPDSLILLPLPASTSELPSNILTATAYEKEQQEEENNRKIERQGKSNPDEFMEMLIREQKQRQGQSQAAVIKVEAKCAASYIEGKSIPSIVEINDEMLDIEQNNSVFKSAQNGINSGKKLPTALQSEASKILCRYGILHHLLGDTTNAVKYYSDAIKFSPTYAACYSWRGDAYNQLGQNLLATQDYIKAFIIRTEYGPTYVHQKVHRISEALKPTLYFVRIGLYLILVPFLLSAIVQSSATRSFLSLCNPIRAVRAAMKCYGKSFLVSFFILIFGFSLMSISMVLPNFQHRVLMNVLSPVLFSFLFIEVFFVSFHMIAQAYDNLRELRKTSTSQG